MTRVYRDIKKSLPTNPNSNYFYLTTIDYYVHSTYIYFCLEDDNFDLNYNDIKFCYTDSNPGYDSRSAVNFCYFYSLSYYGSSTSSSTKKYYYKFSYEYSYDYIIVYYSGSHNDGNLYVTSDDTNLFLDDAALSTVAIVFIVIGSIIVIAVAIIISVCYCACCRRSQPGIMPIGQPAAYVAPNPSTYPNNYGATMPLQPPGVYSSY